MSLPHPLVATLAAAALLSACGGQLDVPSDASVGDALGDGRPDSSLEDCGGVECPAGYLCVEGHCVVEDLCDGVVCSNSGDVCQQGVCIAGGADNDRDGVIARDDCDDHDATRFPGATEACNGLDDDCDDIVDEGFDLDADGWTSCLGDCDDGAPAINPEAQELCNGADDDCDDVIDEDAEVAGGWTGWSGWSG